MATIVRKSVATPRHVVGILGGGITGLSAAYYLQRKFGPQVQPVVLESSGRCGGWVRSIKHDANLYEMGPRSVRPAGVSGMNTLDLVEELGLHSNVIYVPPEHPAAKNRLLYIGDKLVPIPMDLGAMAFTAVPPFQEPMIKTVLREIFKPRKISPDESLHSFISRRFGSHLADTLVDPMIRGITAGDAREISVKFLARGLFDMEQQFGSVTLGSLIAKWRNYVPYNPWIEMPSYSSIPSSSLASTAAQEGWSIWALETGLESIPDALEEAVVGGGGRILKNSRVESIQFGRSNQEERKGCGDEGHDPNHITIYYQDEKGESQQIPVSHMINAMPSAHLSRALRNANSTSDNHISQLINLLDQSSTSADVTVTNLKYREYFKHQAFGFLVPSNNTSVPNLLGVVFNTCPFPQADGDVLITAMSRGLDQEKVLEHVRKILGLLDPVHIIHEELKQCIPQYTVGHYERVEGMRDAIEAASLPLSLAGASFDGVSVNDCIMSGRKAAELLPIQVADSESNVDRRSTKSDSSSSDNSISRKAKRARAS